MSDIGYLTDGREPRMTAARWLEIERAIWTVEIALDSAMCDDGGETEDVRIDAENLLRDATRLRRRLIEAFSGEKPA